MTLSVGFVSGVVGCATPCTRESKDNLKRLVPCAMWGTKEGTLAVALAILPSLRSYTHERIANYPL